MEKVWLKIENTDTDLQSEATTTESVVRSRRYHQLYEQIYETLRLQRVQLCALHLQLFKPFEKQ